MAKILLVEDYESIRDAYTIALMEAGFETDSASSGAEALRKVARTDYDAICLDMVMMQFSGLEFLQAFRAKRPNSATKVVVVSNIDNPKIMERARALGVEQYLVKAHYTPKQVADVMRVILGAAR